MSRSAKHGKKGKDKRHAKDHAEDVPQGEKEGALAFQVLSEQNTKEILGLSIEDIQRKLAELFSLTQHSVDLKDGAILDYFTCGVYWAKGMSFTLRQTSGFFTLLHTLLENVKDHHLSLVDNMKAFKKMMSGIGVESPLSSGGLDFFDVDHAKLISDYVFTSFFQHYKLYEFVFSHTQAEEIIGADLDIEVAKPSELPYPAPLDEGVSEEMYQSYIATPPPSPEPVVVPEVKIDPIETETNIFEELTVDDVREVVESVAQEMLTGLQTELLKKLRNKEGDILARINKIHQVAET
ncbi:ciliary-associated calcium-binding coiled-coil protein 1-like isoform X2 [Liolophura sinensis]|uniref:ciliary-associated calcium-binding coiled-coil protein 1-like isoform X2 n=1 Tax=Liolophura sinensis TaxID=3198878 RepID=UPI003158C128